MSFTEKNSLRILVITAKNILERMFPLNGGFPDHTEVAVTFGEKSDVVFTTFS